MSTMSDTDQHIFLSEPRIAVLSWLSSTGAPLSAPVWYEWDGTNALMFTSKTYAKVRHLQADPRATLMVARPAMEIEEWVAIDGEVAFFEEGVADLVSRSAARYWNLDDPYPKATLAQWLEHIDGFLGMRLISSRIRSYTSKAAWESSAEG